MRKKSKTSKPKSVSVPKNPPKCIISFLDYCKENEEKPKVEALKYFSGLLDKHWDEYHLIFKKEKKEKKKDEQEQEQPQQESKTQKEDENKKQQQEEEGIGQEVENKTLQQNLKNEEEPKNDRALKKFKSGVERNYKSFESEIQKNKTLLRQNTKLCDNVKNIYALTQCVTKVDNTPELDAMEEVAEEQEEEEHQSPRESMASDTTDIGEEEQEEE